MNEAKIPSIFANAMADAAFEETQIAESKKVDKAIKAVKGALDKAHTGILLHQKAKPLHNILSNYDRNEAIALLHKYIKEYESFINGTTFITGRYVIYEKDPYADKTDLFIQNDIKFSIMIVYFEGVTEEGVKAAITKSLKVIFKNDIEKQGY